MPRQSEGPQLELDFTHAPEPSPPKSFKELKREWDEKLRSAGFRDIEREDHRGERQLQVWDSHYFYLRNQPANFEIKQGYFYRAHHFLNDYDFENETDRHIWQLHSEGASLRQIAESIRVRGGKSGKDRVSQVIKRLQEAMREQEICASKTL